MQIDSVLSALAIVVTVTLGYVGLRKQIKKEKAEAIRLAAEDQAKKIAEAVKAATDPLVAQLTQRTADHDFWRERAADLQDQLNRRPTT